MMKLLFSLITTAFILTLSGCKTGSDDPKIALDHFFAAMANGNFTDAGKWVTKDSEGLLSMLQLEMKDMPDSTREVFNKSQIKIGKATIFKNRAAIPIREISGNAELDFTLMKENGEWRVAIDFPTMMQMIQKR